jgi:hypothetical protein
MAAASAAAAVAAVTAAVSVTVSMLTSTTAAATPIHETAKATATTVMRARIAAFVYYLLLTG